MIPVGICGRVFGKGMNEMVIAVLTIENRVCWEEDLPVLLLELRAGPVP
jgi:hypothetical protein